MKLCNKYHTYLDKNTVKNKKILFMQIKVNQKLQTRAREENKVKHALQEHVHVPIMMQFLAFFF